MTIFLLNKEVDLDKSELLLSLPFADASDLEQLELASGSWGIENGALVGRFRGNGGGICYTKDRFPGDILIDFYGTMLSPCNNDLNFVLHRGVFGLKHQLARVARRIDIQKHQRKRRDHHIRQRISQLRAVGKQTKMPFRT